jgi:hypothetical protein
MNENESQPPDEERIAALLGRFQPRPSERFYRRMAAAPWARPKERRTPRSWWSPGMRPTAAAAALALLALLALAAVPSLNALGRQLLEFFLPAAGDTRSVQVTVPQPAALSTPASYTLDLAEARAAAGYPLLELRELPPGMAFSGAHYEPGLQAVTLRYTGDNQTLLFTQRPVGTIEEYSSIGASAPVETVQVWAGQGEYVSGGWVTTPSGDRQLQAATPGTQVSLGLVWDADLPQRILRWRAGGMQYEILIHGAALAKEELVQLAESLREEGR